MNSRLFFFTLLCFIYLSCASARRVCCLKGSGPPLFTSSRKCHQIGGKVVPDYFCRRPVCCKVPGRHPFFASWHRCRRLGGKPVHPSRCRR
eukprot:IDg23633t1